MKTERPAPGDASHYAIRIKGHLDDRWSTWFEGMPLVAQPDGTTVIECPAIDQAALHGLLRIVRDAGLPLISVTPANAPERIDQ